MKDNKALKVCFKVLLTHPKQQKDFIEGRNGALNYLVGVCMRYNNKESPSNYRDGLKYLKELVKQDGTD